MNNESIFKEGDNNTKIRYIITYFNKENWHYYLDFSNINDAIDCFKKLTKLKPNIPLAIFKKTEHITIEKFNKITRKENK